jgi:hypothetical protein
MLSSIETQLSSMTDTESSSSVQEQTAWIETAIVILNGISGLLATYLHVLMRHSSFPQCWQILLSHFKTLLKFEILDINTAVYKTLCQILSYANTDTKVGTEVRLDRDSIDLVWKLWSLGLPLSEVEPPRTRSNNQDCLIAYVSALKEIYRLMELDLDLERCQRVLILLRETVQRASVSAYSADIEYLTALQTQVLQSLSMIRTDTTGVPAAMVKQVAEFVELAFKLESQDSPSQEQPTYVALSKASMTVLQSLIITHASDPEIYNEGAFALALTALSKPIAMKYAFKVKPKSLAPWRQATTTALAILEATLPVISSSTISVHNSRLIWLAIVEISNGITAADCSVAPDGTSIKADQDFDIASFFELRELTTPALGNVMIPDKTRRIYTESLFRTSLIHTPEPRELPQMNQELLASLYQPRKGSTVDSLPSPRTKMSYVCFDELVSMLRVDDGSPGRIKLAQAAAPYFILRAAITLRTYNADQPLRGQMPQPLSQRKELLYVLKALVGLRCEPEAIPDTPGMESEGKKHLHRLYPLLARGVRAAFRDQEVLEWMGKALDEVGADFDV